MKSRNSDNKGCVQSIPSTCIPWSGPNIDCLGIKTGDCLTDVVQAIANRALDLSDELDMTDLDLSCLIEKSSIKPEDQTFKVVFKLLYDNQCKLKDLIDAIDGTGGDSTAPTVNMKCLRIFDDFDNEVKQDLGQMLQSLVNNGCSNQTRIVALEAKSTSLQKQIDDIDLTPTVAEATVTTCLSTTTKPVSQAVVQTAQDLCNYKSKVGSLTDIQAAMARQAPDLNTLLGTTEGWELTPANMAQSMSNMQLVIANLLSRINLIENNCCKVTCDSVTIGFDVLSNTDGDAVTLKFTTKAGTKIPVGFEDCGSVVTITDKNDTSVEYPITILQGQSTEELQITGLDLSDFLTFSIAVKLCAEGISCEKCVSRKWKPISSCPYCEIDVTGSGTNSIIIITYED